MRTCNPCIRIKEGEIHKFLKKESIKEKNDTI